jgi:uncharacterized iron-regulated membrane protein
MTPGTIRVWSWVHKWSSLVSTAFLLMLCLTGLPLVFTHELNHLLLDQSWQAASPTAPKKSLDDILATALAREPGDVPAFMSFDEDRPVVNVTSRPAAGPATAFHFQPIDQTTGDPARRSRAIRCWSSCCNCIRTCSSDCPGCCFWGRWVCC